MKMKKLIASTMAAAIVACAAVPAFAAGDITSDKGTNELKINTTKDSSFTVTIPADVQVTWGTTYNTPIDVKVTSALAPTKSIKVSAETDKTMVNSADPSATFSYTFDTTEKQTSGPVVTAETLSFPIEISDSAMLASLPAGTYEDTITFTATVMPEA